MHHAKAMTKPGHYLEMLDVILYAYKQDAELKLLLNHPDTLQFGNGGAIETIQHMLNIEDEDLSLGAKKWTNHWSMILTRADFKPEANPIKMNHWMPCWPATEIMWQCEKDRLKTQRERKERVLLEQLQEAPEEADLIYDYLRETAESSNAFEALVDRVFKNTGLLPKNVQADGNCGIWSLVSLFRGSPFDPSSLSSEGHRSDSEDQQQLRECLSQMWPNVIEDLASKEARVFLRMFDHTLVGVDEPQSEVKILQQEDAEDRQGQIHAQDARGKDGEVKDELPELQPHQPPSSTCSDQTSKKVKIETPLALLAVKKEIPNSEPSTPPNSKRLDELFLDYTPPHNKPTARRSVNAGILHARPSSGPSVPLSRCPGVLHAPKAEKIEKASDAGGPIQADQAVKTEPKIKQEVKEEMEPCRVHLFLRFLCLFYLFGYRCYKCYRVRCVSIIRFIIFISFLHPYHL